MSADLPGIRARLAAVEPSLPWDCHPATNGNPSDGPTMMRVDARDMPGRPVIADFDYSYEGGALADLLVNAPTDLTALLAEVERLQTSSDAWRHECKRLMESKRQLTADNERKDAETQAAMDNLAALRLSLDLPDYENALRADSLRGLLNRGIEDLEAVEAEVERQAAVIDKVTALADGWLRDAEDENGPICADCLACSVCVKAEQAIILRAALDHDGTGRRDQAPDPSQAGFCGSERHRDQIPSVAFTEGDA